MKMRSLLSSTGLVGVLSLASPAFAQASPPTCTPEQQTAGGCTDAQAADGSAPVESADGSATGGAQSVIVTGSRIRRPNLVSTVPVTSVGGEEFHQTGQVSVGDVLNELPALRSTFSQANSTRFLGTAGLNLLDLRGLGTQRTLVLVNGRRHVGSDILNNAVSPDVNTIPTDLIERVDVVTGGNSAIYGSDAIAGVVNFVLKRDFQGIQMRAQAGVSQYGDAGSYFVSGTAGTNFADGRGNIAINAEYARQNQYFGGSRPNLRQQDGFIVVDTDPAGAPNGADGTPDRLFFRDIRSASLTNTGLVRFGGTGGFNCGADPIGGFYNCPYQFTPDGALVPVTGQRVGLGPNGSFIGGNGENFRGGNQFQISPQLNRYTVNLIGHLTLSDAFEPFIEAKYARIDSFGSGSSGPAFITGTTLGDSRERPQLDNPFLSPQARALITQQLTIANGGVAPAANARFSLRENLLGLGVRSEEATRETWRGVFGVRGTFNGDWNYEASVNYGRFTERTKVLGNLNIQRFLLSMDAARNPAGTIVCRSQFDPAARIGYVDNGATLANDIAGCVPVNPFGGQFTQAQRDYLLANTTSVGRITQFVANAFLSGDTSQWFELPGGPIGFAIGGEYRRETNRYQQDPLVEQGYTFYNAIPTFAPPAFAVKEAFAELRVPLLRDVPFFQELTLSGAARVADYRGSTGTVYAYNAGIDWAPVHDLRFRANYSRAVRAPNLVELYTPPGQNFAPGFADPCSRRNIGTGSANRAANCAAAGIPTNYDFVYSQSLEIVSGGNPNLGAETSNSFTVGGVYQPSFIPGLSLSVDYFDIKVNNVISSVSAQTIVDQCYDSASLSNPYCALFQRAGAGGGPRGEVANQILEGSLLQSSLNFAQLRARGIDAELNYRHRFEGIGTFNGRLTYTHNFQRDDFLDPTDPSFADRQLLELGTPKDEFSLNTSLNTGPFTFGYKLRYVGRQVLNAYEDVFSTQGRPPENADFADRTFYPAVFYHDFRLGIDAGSDFNFYVGVDNAFNRLPPLGLTGIGGGSAIYDVRGRSFYAGATVHF
jgi:outer membrane receptor protein involved in Fe transport